MKRENAINTLTSYNYRGDRVITNPEIGTVGTYTCTYR